MDLINQTPLYYDAVYGNKKSTFLNVSSLTEYLARLTEYAVNSKYALALNGIRYESFVVSSDTLLRYFSLGGRVACESTLAKYLPNLKDNFDGFNSPAQVANWVNTSLGSSALLSWAYATDQFIEGTGSAKLTFTQSDQNNYPEISYNFPTARDLSKWRYVYASARTTIAAGGAQSRRVQIRLTSGTAVRIWEIVGTTTTPPFSIEQWHTIIGEIESPHSTAGTGTFDITSVNQISLRLLDGGNKAGSIWWDDVYFKGEITTLEKIYSAQGSTIKIAFDPVKSIPAGTTLLLITKNNGATAGEVNAGVIGAVL